MIVEQSAFNGLENEANARLLTAAPEVLAALIKAETWVATFVRVNGCAPEGPAASDLAEIRAAIQKARGE